MEKKSIYLPGERTPRDVEVQALLQLFSARLEERGQTVTIAEIEAVISVPYASGSGNSIVRRARRGLRAAGIETIAVPLVGIRSLPDAEITPVVNRNVGRLRRGLRRQIPALQNVRTEHVTKVQSEIRDHLLAKTALQIANMRRMERETMRELHLTCREPAPRIGPPAKEEASA